MSKNLGFYKHTQQIGLFSKNYSCYTINSNPVCSYLNPVRVQGTEQTFQVTKISKGIILIVLLIHSDHVSATPTPGGCKVQRKKSNTGIFIFLFIRSVKSTTPTPGGCKVR